MCDVVYDFQQTLFQNVNGDELGGRVDNLNCILPVVNMNKNCSGGGGQGRGEGRESITTLPWDPGDIEVQSNSPLEPQT